MLELEPGAAAFDVKAAYRKLAKKWHPDKNPDDTQVRVVVLLLYVSSGEEGLFCSCCGYFWHKF